MMMVMMMMMMVMMMMRRTTTTIIVTVVMVTLLHCLQFFHGTNWFAGGAALPARTATAIATPPRCQNGRIWTVCLSCSRWGLLSGGHLIPKYVSTCSLICRHAGESCGSCLFVVVLSVLSLSLSGLFPWRRFLSRLTWTPSPLLASSFLTLWWAQLCPHLAQHPHGFAHLAVISMAVSVFSPPARWGLLDFMSVACSSPLLLLLLNRDPRSVCPAGPQPRPSTLSVLCRTSTTTIHAQCSLPDLNHDHPRPVFPAGPQPRPSTPSVPCRTSTASIHAKCSLPDLM